MPGPAPAPVHAYRPPQLLRDVLLLDVLELTGSTQRASRHLSLSQPSISRRYQRLARDFGLRRDRRVRWGCRFGSNGSIRHLRQAARAHRIDAGQLALGCDPLHRPLLEGWAGLLLPPPCFLAGADWSHLLREGVVDAALVPALEREGGVGPGVRAVELGRLPLALLAPQGGGDRPVLAPAPEQAPGLVKLLQDRGLSLCRAPRPVQDWAGWLALLEPCGPRLVVPRQLAQSLPAGGVVALEPLAPDPDGDLRERLWLLLAEELVERGMEARILTDLRRALAERPEP